MYKADVDSTKPINAAHKTQWVMHTIMMTTVGIVDLIYWLIIYNPDDNFSQMDELYKWMAHAANFFVAMIERTCLDDDGGDSLNSLPQRYSLS